MLSKKSIFIIRRLYISSYIIYKNNEVLMQQNVLNQISSSHVAQMIQFVHSLYAAEWNPE